MTEMKPSLPFFFCQIITMEMNINRKPGTDALTRNLVVQLVSTKLTSFCNITDQLFVTSTKAVK